MTKLTLEQREVMRGLRTYGMWHPDGCWWCAAHSEMKRVLKDLVNIGLVETIEIRCESPPFAYRLAPSAAELV
ncbi:hypothetical protein [Bradyrhizobium sp. HKCCYLS20291]|uniref:hypothetical protein n=1 Tax=Bradyrhizobium sp. HKCCYLS20291 TaxID=3420766 RepID=UPI003EBDE3E3